MRSSGVRRTRGWGDKAIREPMYAHKTIWKLKESDNKYLINIYSEFKKILVQLYQNILKIIDRWYDESLVNKIETLIRQIKDVVDKKALNPLIDNLKESKDDATIISDTLYMDHYFHLACISLFSALTNLYGKEPVLFDDVTFFEKIK